MGQLIGSDGKNYTTLPSGVTAVAMIAYVSGSNGLALALTDDAYSSQWSEALDYADAHTPVFTGGTWKVPSLEEWKQMIKTANGGDETSNEGLNTAIINAGGESIYNGYWTRTEADASNAYRVYCEYPPPSLTVQCLRLGLTELVLSSYGNPLEARGMVL